jgi:hypothetical protein
MHEHEFTVSGISPKLFKVNHYQMRQGLARPMGIIVHISFSARACGVIRRLTATTALTVAVAVDRPERSSPASRADHGAFDG